MNKVNTRLNGKPGIPHISTKIRNAPIKGAATDKLPKVGACATADLDSLIMVARAKCRPTSTNGTNDPRSWMLQRQKPSCPNLVVLNTERQPETIVTLSLSLRILKTVSKTTRCVVSQPALDQTKHHAGNRERLGLSILCSMLILSRLQGRSLFAVFALFPIGMSDRKRLEPQRPHPPSQGFRRRSELWRTHRRGKREVLTG